VQLTHFAGGVGVEAVGDEAASEGVVRYPW